MSRVVISHNDKIAGLIEIQNAVPIEWCNQMIEHTEAIGYNDQSHPLYQNRSLDTQEKMFRRNHRCVLQANEHDNINIVWDAVKDVVPQCIDTYTDYGTWLPHSPNDMWRFYRYKSSCHDKDDDDDDDECFPVHLDNTTVKAHNFMSWMTVL
eukprot:PhM_4_TR14076/c2_g1_i1/m.60824